MSSPSLSNIIHQLASQIDDIAVIFSHDGFETISNYIKGPLGIACIIYIALRGISITIGIIETPIRDLTKSAIRIGLIYFFIFNWGHFNDFVIRLFKSFSDQVGSSVMNLNALHLPVPGTVKLQDGLQKVLEEVMQVGATTMAKGSITNLSPMFSAIMIYFAGGSVISLAFLDIMGAKLMSCILFTLAPIFISLTLFDKTRGYFDRWLGYLVGFTFVVIFVSAVVGFAIGLIHWSVNDILTDILNTHGENITTVSWFPIFICSLFCLKAISEAARMGLSIGGTCTHANGSAMVGAFMMGAMGTARSTSGSISKLKALSPLAKGSLGVGKKVLMSAIDKNTQTSIKMFRKSAQGM